MFGACILAYRHLKELVVCFLPQTAYIDVCDDTSYAWRAKSLMKRALDANVPAITTAGIYPGVSNGAYLPFSSVMFPNQDQKII